MFLFTLCQSSPVDLGSTDEGSDDAKLSVSTADTTFAEGFQLDLARESTDGLSGQRVSEQVKISLVEMPDEPGANAELKALSLAEPTEMVSITQEPEQEIKDMEQEPEPEQEMVSITQSAPAEIKDDLKTRKRDDGAEHKESVKKTNKEEARKKKELAEAHKKKREGTKRKKEAAAGKAKEAAKDGEADQLMMAIQKGYLPMVKRLLDAKADPDANDGTTSTMHAAVSNGRNAIVELLINYKADVNFQSADSAFNTPLHVASKKNDPEMVKILCNADADVTKKNKEGKTPIDIAESSKRADLVIRLLHDRLRHQQNRDENDAGVD